MSGRLWILPINSRTLGLLDKAVHAFPSRKDVLARAGKQLTRPELAVLMAYSKLALKRALLEAASFLQGEWANDLLAGYFPEVVRSRYADHLKDHSLAREIAATMICNKVIDQAGGCFPLFGEGLVPDLLIDAVGLYLAFDQILEGDRWRDAVRALDGKMTTSRQYEYILQLENALAYLCRWALQRGRRLQPRKDEIAEWRAYLRDYLDHFSESVEFAILGSTAPEVSRQLFLNRLRDFPILVELSQSAGQDIRVAAELYDDAVVLFGLRQIATLLAEVKARDAWERRLQTALDDRFRAAPARVASFELRMGSREPTAFFRRLGFEVSFGQASAIARRTGRGGHTDARGLRGLRRRTRHADRCEQRGVRRPRGSLGDGGRGRQRARRCAMQRSWRRDQKPVCALDPRRL